MRPENYEARRQPPSNEYELNIGPNHPGIEGNYAFRLRLHGDKVIEGRMIRSDVQLVLVARRLTPGLVILRPHRRCSSG